MKKFLIACGMMIASVANAAEYFTVLDTPESVMLFERGSLSIEKFAKQTVGLIRVRGVNKSDPTTAIDMYAYVRINECKKGSGTIVFLNSKKILNEQPYTIGTGSGFTQIATALCGLSAVQIDRAAKQPTM